MRPLDSKDSRATHKKKMLEEKESYPWVVMTQKAAQGFPPETKVVMVGLSLRMSMIAFVQRFRN